MSNRLGVGDLDVLGAAARRGSSSRPVVQNTRASERRASGSLQRLSGPLDEDLSHEPLPHFVVSYELGPDWTDEEYKDLYRVLRSFHSWTWVLDSVWVLQASDADFVRDMIRPLLDESDGLLVMQVTRPLDDVIDGAPYRPSAASRRGQALSETAFG